VALQALTVISMGSIADRRAPLLHFCLVYLRLTSFSSAPHRKRLLLTFAFLGAAAAAIFLALPSSSPVWLLSALLAVLANIGFGASVVAMNAYLPSLAKISPEVIVLLEELEDVHDPTIADSEDSAMAANSNEDSINATSEEPLLHNSRPNEATHDLKKQYDTALSNAVSRISSLGIALGYLAGIVLLILTLIPVTSLHGSTFSLRLAIGLSGIWQVASVSWTLFFFLIDNRWAVFSVPAAIWLPGTIPVSAGDPPAWIDDSGIGATDNKWHIRKQVVAAWKRLGGMLRWSEIKKLRNTFKYLAAWFLLSDGRSSRRL
jgi:MFS transporter, UMF1 family